jgi:hypothetical protein
MAEGSPSNRPGPFSKQALGAMVVSALIAPLTKAALEQAAKLPKAMADRRRKPRLRNEAIYPSH